MKRAPKTLAFATAATMVAGLMTAPQASARFHSMYEKILANYVPQIEQVQNPELKSQLQQRVVLLQAMFVVCGTRDGHSQELIDGIKQEIRVIAEALRDNPQQLEIAFAEADKAEREALNR